MLVCAHRPLSAQPRRGAVLIVVSGIAAILLVISVAFLTRMRSDAEENRLVVRDAQARIMLVAACNYIQEASRLGWDDPATPEHEEGFGWVDVRDGSPGPKVDGVKGANDTHALDRFGRRPFALGSGRWPDIGGLVRVPFHVMRRPPYATRLTAAYNPIVTDRASPDFGFPYLRNPDPQPVEADRQAFARGDLRPRPESVGLGWFRVLRLTSARFLITCGAGASQGFRDWDGEVVPAGATGRFGSREAFDDIVAGEVRMWYLVEWSASCGDNYGNLNNHDSSDHYRWRPVNASHEGQDLSQPNYRNPVGTIRWVQRLEQPPAEW